MSYILEALKKSEQQRRNREERPILQYDAAAAAPVSKNRRAKSALPLVFSGFLLIALFTFLLTRQLLRSDNEPQAEPPIPSKTVPAPKTSGDVIFIQQSKTKIKYPPVKIEDKETQSTASSGTVIHQPAPLFPDAPPSPQGAPVKLFSANEDRYRHIPFLEELDEVIRAQLPQLKLAGHTYSQNPALRLIVINNAIVREKDIVERVLTLEEILPDGILLRKGDIRFRMLIKNSL